jgi:hypothetical protein
VLVALALPATAHVGGRAQLFVDRLGLHSVGGVEWEVSVALIDADSGTPQAGFDVAAEATDGAGHRAGPVVLRDRGGGRYTAPLTAAPGRWEVSIRADTLPGGMPAVPLRKTYPLDLEPGQDVTVGARAPGHSGSGGGVSVPLLAAVATVGVVGWFILGRGRRRHGAIPARS